jgi:hypothetical protein
MDAAKLAVLQAKTKLTHYPITLDNVCYVNLKSPANRTLFDDLPQAPDVRNNNKKSENNPSDCPLTRRPEKQTGITLTYATHSTQTFLSLTSTSITLPRVILMRRHDTIIVPAARIL